MCKSEVCTHEIPAENVAHTIHITWQDHTNLRHFIDGLMQKRQNSRALAMELQ